MGGAPFSTVYRDCPLSVASRPLHAVGGKIRSRYPSTRARVVGPSEVRNRGSGKVPAVHIGFLIGPITLAAHHRYG